MAKLKLTEDLVKEMCRNKSAGLTNKSVCHSVGICEATFYDYYKKGEEALLKGKDNIYSEFLKSYQKAEVGHKLKRLQQIQAAAVEGNWQAAAWELERCYPAEYGRRAVEVIGKDGGAIQAEVEVKGKVEIDLGKLSDKELESLGEIADKITDGQS